MIFENQQILTLVLRRLISFSDVARTCKCAPQPAPSPSAPLPPPPAIMSSWQPINYIQLQYVNCEPIKIP